jgi:hypothetical protein
MICVLIEREVFNRLGKNNEIKEKTEKINISFLSMNINNGASAATRTKNKQTEWLCRRRRR